MRYHRLLPFLTRFNYHLLGRHKLRANPADISCQPFFILGSGRNGSTLLSMILNGHSKLFLPPEQYALHFAAIRFQLYGFLIWRDLVKIVIGEFADDKNNEGWKTNFNALYHPLYMLPKEQRSFQKIIDKIIEATAYQHHKEFTLWGDKSPTTIWYLEYIYNVYPKSKYIFLVRDGRDVVNSYQKGGTEVFGDLANIEKAAKNWQQSIDKWKWLKKRAHQERLLEVRYEDLVQDPTMTIHKICDFLLIPFEGSMLNFHDTVRERVETKRGHYKALHAPINNSAIGKWREQLTVEDIGRIMPIIEKGLKIYHYT